MCFVRDFDLQCVEKTMTAKIAVDSKYWLFINGNLAVFEGGLKRGPGPRAFWYDEPNLSRFLRPGRNRIAILVWFFGKNGFSHVSSGHGGLYFEMKADGEKLFSDQNWKIRKNDAFISTLPDESGPNYRLPESDIVYDASRAFGEWFRLEYSVEDWESAEVLPPEDQDSFGLPFRRDIPFFRDAGIHDFLNTDEVQGICFRQNTVLEMRLPCNLQFTPCLHLNAPAGKKIVIQPLNNYIGQPEICGVRSVYFTRDGDQAFESPGWMNGETVLFDIPAGVKVERLQYRETGYDTETVGSFSCDDPFLNRLWEKSRRTLYVCMRDTFMDCPDRERTQWWGDVNLQMQMLVYCMDQKAMALYEHGADMLVKWYETTGMMATVVPSGIMQFELPLQNLSVICGFWMYALYTGRRELVEKVYPMCRSYLALFHRETDGLVRHREGSWDWPDWGENADIAIMDNAWYCLALSACSNMARLLGKEQDAREYDGTAEGIRKAVCSMVDPDGAFFMHTANGLPDDRANALAVLAHFHAPEQTDAILDVLRRIENASPYMEKYVLDALCEMGHVEDALERIRRRYGPMTEDSGSTLWERWTPEFSLNHGWTGGPLITLSKYVAGIAPVTPDGRTWRVWPCLCGLRHIDCTVPTPLGTLRVQISNEQGKKTMRISCLGDLKIQARPPRYDRNACDSSEWEIELMQ